MTALAIVFTGRNTKNRTIYECPEISGCDTIRITISEDNSGCIEHMNGVFTDLRLKRALTDELTRDIIQFTNGDTSGIERIRHLLGFMPTYKIVDNHLKYINPSEFATLKKPIVYADVFGVQVPKAFINWMHELQMPDLVMGDTTITNYDRIRECISELLNNDYNESVIKTALEKLEVSGSVFTKSDMAVYCNMGFIHAFSGLPLFIDGDVLRTDALDSRMLAGNLNPTVYRFEMPTDLNTYTDFGPSFWKRTNVYKEVFETLIALGRKSAAHERAIAVFLDGE